MHIVHMHHVSVNFGGREIFTDLNWAIDHRARVGLVGPNGVGKSTLLRTITGEIAPYEGTVVKTGPVRIGRLPQDINLPPGRTLLETALVLPPLLAQVEAEIDALETALGNPDVYEDSNRLTQVMDQLEKATTRYDQLGGARHPSRVKELLFRLGFTPDDFDLPAESLSGGQKKLVMLVRLALDQPELLLLDEPDNHLDMESKSHLEAFIRSYHGAVVIISHDRYLLDETVTQIAEMENGKLKLYPGSYSQYANQKELDRLRQEQAYVAQQKEIARIEAAIARFELWASIVVNERHIKQARSRRRMLDRMEERGEIIEKVYEQRTMNLQLEGWRGSTNAVVLDNLTMAFDDDPLFMDVDLLLRHGERVGLIGPNGAGKSVLFRLILGELEPVDGLIKVGPSTKIGYYAQEHQTLIDWLDRTPIDLIRDVQPMPENTAVTHLLRFAFTYEQARQPIRTLSGGERSRIQLMRLMLARPNLLLLDEPTNNLDIASTEVLENALSEFEGAILAISHDRYFLERMADRIIELRDGTLTSYVGGYTDYLAATGRLSAAS